MSKSILAKTLCSTFSHSNDYRADSGGLFDKCVTVPFIKWDQRFITMDRIQGVHKCDGKKVTALFYLAVRRNGNHRHLHVIWQLWELF